MSFSQRLREVRDGFERAFWVANLTELFERLAFYAQQSVLVVFLHEILRFSQEDSGKLTGFFGGTVWFLAVLGGTFADRIGFRRALGLAYLILGLGYFLIGSLSAPWMAGIRESLPLYWIVFFILFIPALGPAIIKPSVVGVTARGSKENVRSLGFSIYYTMVNIGSTLGPLTALYFRRTLGIESVFKVCALTAVAMSVGVFLFFREPKRPDDVPVTSVKQSFQNFIAVLGKRPAIILSVAGFIWIVARIIGFSVPWPVWALLAVAAVATMSRFMIFLVIFSGYWVMFWQEFISIPLYIRGYVNPESDIELLLTVDPLVVILFTILISYLFRKLRSFPTVTLGVLVTTLCWVLFAVNDFSWQINTTLNLGFMTLPLRGFPVIAGLALFILAIGEIIQQPRYYEYISTLAPAGQQGTYMGFAFMPLGIGYYIGGWLGGSLLHHYGEVVKQPRQMWWIFFAIGIATTLLMVVYDRIVKPGKPAAAPSR